MNTMHETFKKRRESHGETMLEFYEIHTEEDLDTAKSSCVALDQASELTIGCETWGILYGSQRGQMSRWPNGRGAVCYGGDSLWGDWNGSVLTLDDGSNVTADGKMYDVRDL